MNKFRIAAGFAAALSTLVFITPVSADTSLTAPDAPLPYGSYIKNPEDTLLNVISKTHWQVVQQQPGELQIALLDYKGYDFTVDLNYSDNRVVFTPVSSRKPKCEGSAEKCKAAAKYTNRWMLNLRRQISSTFLDLAIADAKKAL